jgi:predicted outer membrane repeat protein
MYDLFHTVSNGFEFFQVDFYQGESTMEFGSTALLAVGLYKCSDGYRICARPDSMLWTIELNGEVKCVEDNASCVLDGENARRVMLVSGTYNYPLMLRALTFDKGSAEYGGGIVIDSGSGATVDLKLCVFSTNTATGSNYGGGAIYVLGGVTNTYGTSFNANTAATGNGNDIYDGTGTVTIHNTCPSPYSSRTPIQGKTRMRIV